MVTPPLAGGYSTVALEDIDSGTASPTGQYRWRDAADQNYAESYRNSYNYTQAAAEVNYSTDANTLYGTLTAFNLKPNFAYQLKLAGTSGMPGNENIGLTGRWWQEEWNGTAWVNGQNLNNKGDGNSPNPNDYVYFERCDINDTTSPTGKHYKYTGYLLFDYFITDNDGSAVFDFRADSSYHVLWKTSQRAPTLYDGPVRSATFDPDPCSAAYDANYGPATVQIFGEWERLPVGGVMLPAGGYEAQFVLTEESFHSCSVQYGGCWAGAMAGTAGFTIPVCMVGFDDLAAFALEWLQEGGDLGFDLDDSNDVDFADYAVLADFWLDYCPNEWPL